MKLTYQDLMTNSWHDGLRPVFVFALLLGLAACGVQVPSSTNTDTQSSSDQAEISTGQAAIKTSSTSPFLSIPTSVAPDSEYEDHSAGAGFALADATSYSISLTGCATGLTGTATQVDPNLKVYKQDRGCLGQLTEFVFNGNTYSPVTGEEFSTYLANDTAFFANDADPDDQVMVIVISQLSTPISVADTVSYKFGINTVGAADGSAVSISKSTVSSNATGQALVVASQDPPNFTITNVSFSGVSTSGGAGRFVFEMTCGEALVGDLCDGVNLSLIKYRLINDTYSGVLLYQEAQTLFPTGATTVVVGTDKFVTGNGGFNSVELTGPDQIHLNPNMILVLEANGLSYQYFNVDVQVVTNP